MQVDHRLNLEETALKDPRMALVGTAWLAQRSYHTNWLPERV